MYVGGFLAVQAALSPLTRNSDPIAVAASTLAALGLFQPLRRRLQDAMDRRFNRVRYDASRTEDAFATSLRNEVDLDTDRASRWPGRSCPGTLAFLFTDLAGGTRLWEQQPDAMSEALKRHDAVLRAAIEEPGVASSRPRAMARWQYSRTLRLVWLRAWTLNEPLRPRHGRQQER